MNNLQLLTEVLEYIELNIQSDIRTEDIAQHCYCSKSTIEKLFRNICHISVHDYIVRRKMVIAAKALHDKKRDSILDIALELGFHSHEVFTRTFRKVWNCSPSEYVNRYQFTNLYPKYAVAELEGVYDMAKKVDISELYDLFQERKECYFVCVDICQMKGINEIARKAGDLAIIETMKRLSDAAGEDDMVFRIGGDEFAILTNSEQESYASKLVEKITSNNGVEFDYLDKKIPLILYASMLKINVNRIRYSELFAKLHQTIDENKK